MANIQQDVRTFIAATTAITAIVGSRIHYNYAPAASPKPNIWFRVNSDREQLTMDAVGGLHEATLDLECVGESPDDAQNLADAVKSRLHGYKGTIGSHSCKGAFMSDKDDDYMPYSNQSDVGAHVAAFTVDLWYSS